MLSCDEFLTRVSVPLAIDGGMSTELEQQGCRLEGSLWTAQALLDDPGLIEAAHKAYVDAGAGVVITASYQISRAGIVENGHTAEDADRAPLSDLHCLSAPAELHAGSRPSRERGIPD